MAGFLTILGALARSVWRELRTFSSISGNNLALFIVLVMYQQPQSIVFFVMVVAALLLGPLAGDPLRKIPAERMAVWPLTVGERVSLRLGSLALSPVMWVAAPFLFVAGGASFAVLMIGGALAIQIALALWNHFTAGRTRSIGLRWTPKLPGRLGGLVQKNIRQMLSTLDFWAALLLAVSGTAYRLFGRGADPDAFMILSLVVVIALSTYGQCLFGLDLPSGMARYRVLPLRGFEILLAKDMAFLLVAAVLVAPLAFLPGLAGALAAVAVGHHGSVGRPIVQTRWRFTGGVIFPTGFLQVFPLVAVGVATARGSVSYLGLAAAAYAGSVWYYGREWDRGG